MKINSIVIVVMSFRSHKYSYDYTSRRSGASYRMGKREAVLALGMYKVKKVFDALVNVLLNKKEEDIVRTGAVLSLSGLGHKKALLPLLKVLKNRGDNVRSEVVKALSIFKDELVIKHLMMIIRSKNEDTSLRSEAIMALARSDSENKIETLITLAKPAGYK